MSVGASGAVQQPTCACRAGPHDHPPPAAALLCWQRGRLAVAASSLCVLSMPDHGFPSTSAGTEREERDGRSTVEARARTRVGSGLSGLVWVCGMPACFPGMVASHSQPAQPWPHTASRGCARFASHAASRVVPALPRRAPPQASLFPPFNRRAPRHASMAGWGGSESGQATERQIPCHSPGLPTAPPAPIAASLTHTCSEAASIHAD